VRSTGRPPRVTVRCAGFTATSPKLHTPPRPARVFFTLGELYAGKGDEARAADAYRKAIEIDPEMEPAKKRLADITKPGS